MGSNHVSNNNKISVHNSSNKASAAKNESILFNKQDEDLQLGLNGNKKFWEVPAYKSTSSIFSTEQTKSTQSCSETFGLVKTSTTKTNTKKSDNNAKIKTQIAEVIKNDEARGNSKYTAEQISSLIVETSKKYDVDPLIVASIAKQETHFTQESSGKNGKGMMQLTTISLKDMYLRSDVYGKELKPLLDKYGSVEKLLKAVKNNVAVNIEVGTALFKSKLKSAKGNITKALQNYNGSPLKISYAKSVQKYYNAMKK